MSDLPSWSGQALETEVQPQQPQAQQPLPGTSMNGGAPQRPQRNGMMMGLILGLSIGLVLAAVGIGAYWLGSRQADDVAASDQPAPASPDSGEIASDSTDPDDGAGNEGGATLSVDSTNDGEDDEGGADGAADDSSLPDVGLADGQLLTPVGYASTDPNFETRIQQAPEYAVVRGGKVYLYGFAADQESLENSIAITEAVMGPEGYVVERFVDPDTPEVDGAPIYVDDKVLFGFNSTDLDPAVLPIMDLGVALMLQNPTAEMLIIARSDAVGSAEANLEVSQRRGEAVVAYWESQGVERSRMTVEARGEADASEDDSPEVAALNRSVEFVVSGIVDG